MDTIERNHIIAKVKKCLALAKSANEYEAAAGLHQAQRLMNAHGISDLDVTHADIQEASADPETALEPAAWEGGLARLVARAFDCEVFLEMIFPVGRWTFVGIAPRAEIACYAFEELFGQAKRARANYIKTNLKRCCTKTRTRRADLFCRGWVMKVTKLVQDFAGNDAQLNRGLGGAGERVALGVAR